MYLYQALKEHYLEGIPFFTFSLKKYNPSIYPYIVQVVPPLIQFWNFIPLLHIIVSTPKKFVDALLTWYAVSIKSFVSCLSCKLCL